MATSSMRERRLDHMGHAGRGLDGGLGHPGQLDRAVQEVAPADLEVVTRDVHRVEGQTPGRDIGHVGVHLLHGAGRRQVEQER